MYANDVYVNNASLHNARPIPSDSMPQKSPSNLASIIADRQRDVLQRMANKAERARRSRKKRKAYVSDLELQAQTLAEQLRNLSAQETQLSARVQELSHENRLITRNMEVERTIEDGLDALRLDQRELLVAIQSCISELKAEGSTQPLFDLIEKLLQNCGSIAASYDAYLKLAESTVAFGRGQPSEALWILFTSSDHSQKLVSVLDLSKEQQQKLSLFQTRFNLLRTELHNVSKLFREYRLRCEEMLHSRDREIRSIIGIIGPVNFARILSWVHKQTWCMELLNSLFPRYIASSLQQELISS